MYYSITQDFGQQKVILVLKMLKYVIKNNSMYVYFEFFNKKTISSSMYKFSLYYVGISQFSCL